MNKIKKLLWLEVGIEFKACMYFFAFLFFVAIHALSIKEYSISILTMAEIILSTYSMGYIQYFFMDNFDESDKFSLKYFANMIIGILIYTLLNHFLKWCDGNVYWSIAFSIYVLICYLSIYFVFKIRRYLDTELLNEDLSKFKKGLDYE